MSDSGPRRLHVDPTLCDGYGFCAEIVPELIRLDDWGFPILKPGGFDDGDLIRLAQRAVSTCPRLALLLVEPPPDRG